ncbi:MAG: Maf family protein [Sphaerochaetaceae bacterium]
MADFATAIPALVLASGSVARKALLESLGVVVITYKTDCDESHQETDPAKATELLARRKLAFYQSSHQDYGLPVLSCDTLISFQGSLIGKPKTREAALQQLVHFSGKKHEVHSGWALWYQKNVYSGSDLAVITFKTLSRSCIESYLDTNEWIGAAGSYRIQGNGRSLIKKLEGDEATVIGLPLLQISEILDLPLSV